MKFTELIIAVAGILFIFNQLKNLCKHEEDEKESNDDDDVDISTTTEKSDEDVDESTTSEKSDCEESEEEEEEMNVSSVDSEVEEAEEESFEKEPSLKKETSATPRVVHESKIPTVPKSITKPSYEVIRSPTEKTFVILRGNNSERLIMHPKVEEIMKLKNKEEQIQKLLDLEKEMDKEMKATITIPSFDIPDRVRPYRGIFPSMF